MRNFWPFARTNNEQKILQLKNFWEVTAISDRGVLQEPKRRGFLFKIEGVDASFFTADQRTRMHQDWRSGLKLNPGEELQIVFRKRVLFEAWIEEQLRQSFLAEREYGRKILLDRLADKLAQMSSAEPRLLNQEIIGCFWTNEALDEDECEEKRLMVLGMLQSFGFPGRALSRDEIEKEIFLSACGLDATESQTMEWPAMRIAAGILSVNDDQFRALELTKLPENFSEIGMIQSLTAQPYPLDFSVRLSSRDARPVISRLEKKRNLLQAQKGGRNVPSPKIETQIQQIDEILRNLAAKSENLFDMRCTLGLRLPKNLASVQRRALAQLVRAGAKMDFCEFEEPTIGTFDSYLECIPGFRGKNIRSHTVLGSNASHFLPFFRPAKGDPRAIASFETRAASLFNVDPVAPNLANYNWLVSGTSGAGKSFFVNSLIAQSGPLNPNVFIVDIGGSYNKLAQFLGGRVLSLAPGQGFEMSPFFLPPSEDPQEERMRRQHILNIFLEMVRFDGELPAIEIRHLLAEMIDRVLAMEKLPKHPVTYILQQLTEIQSSEAKRLGLLLRPWGGNGFFAQFLDNDVVSEHREQFLAFDLKGLTEFADLSRVVQLIVCASLWAKIRRSAQKQFSWIVLDEVAFSLLKTQPEFVDELVSTLRKHYAGAIVVVQDLEKVTSNMAGSSILQNTQSKAILQQRGDSRNFAEALSLSALDLAAIDSLRREKGRFSDIFLIRDDERTVIRHAPSELEYWLSTTAPEDQGTLNFAFKDSKKNFQESLIGFVKKQGRHP